MIALDFRPPPRILRQFAYIAVVGLALVAALVLRLCGVFSWSHPALLATLAVGGVQLALFLIGVPHLTRLLYVALMVVALPIGFVLSHVLMATVYYLVMTPIGLAFRLFGRDVLGRGPDPGMTSYWRERPARRDPSSYFKLY